MHGTIGDPHVNDVSSPDSSIPDSEELDATARQLMMARAAARRVARHALGNLIHPIALQVQLLERRLNRRPERVPETVEGLQRMLDDARRGLADLDASSATEAEPSARFELGTLVSRVRSACAVPLAVDLREAPEVVEAPPRTLGTGLTVLLRCLDRHGAREIDLRGFPDPALEIGWRFQPVRLRREELEDLVAELGRWSGLTVRSVPTQTPEAGGAIRFELKGG